MQNLEGVMQGYDVVIYGDSISENWRGTSGGLPYIRKDNTSSRPDPNFVAADMRAAFLETLGQQYRVGVMAIAGTGPPPLAFSFLSVMARLVVGIFNAERRIQG